MSGGRHHHVLDECEEERERELSVRESGASNTGIQICKCEKPNNIRGCSLRART